MAKSLTIFYTADLRGDIQRLPRLHSFIRQMKAALPAGSQSLLLDAGDACAPGVWHCAVTGGRSMVVALDGMGYDAANVGACLTDEARGKLGDTVRMALVDQSHSATRGAVELVARPAQVTAQAMLSVVLQPGAAARLEGNVLHLAALTGGQVGAARVALNGSAVLTDFQVCDMPPAALPDPTIAGVVEFILSEARYLQGRRESG